MREEEEDEEASSSRGSMGAGVGVASGSGSVAGELLGFLDVPANRPQNWSYKI